MTYNFLIFLISFIFGNTVLAQSNPKIVLNSDEINYGQIKKGSNGVRSVTIYNSGSAPLNITNCLATCGCTVPTCPREPLLSKQRSQITIKYDTQRVGTFQKTITVYSNDPEKQTILIKIFGEVVE